MMQEHILRKEIITSKIVCRLVGIIVFITLTSLGAFVRIPLAFTPVPLTLQTFFVLLSGAFLGGELGAVTQFSYVLLGASGLPIFSGAGSGVFHFFGPTAGYLFGFVAASWFVGRQINKKTNTLLRVFLLFCAGDLILLSLGVIWLKVLFGYSFTKLLFLGFIPFIPGDLIKVIAASLVYVRLDVRLREIYPS